MTRLDDMFSFIEFNSRRFRNLRPEENQWLAHDPHVSGMSRGSSSPEFQCALPCVTENKPAALWGRSRQRHVTPSTHCTLLWEFIAQFDIKQNGSSGRAGPSEEGSAKRRPELPWMITRSSPWRGKPNVLSFSAKPVWGNGLFAG